MVGKGVPHLLNSHVRQWPGSPILNAIMTTAVSCGRQDTCRDLIGARECVHNTHHWWYTSSAGAVELKLHKPRYWLSVDFMGKLALLSILVKMQHYTDTFIMVKQATNRAELIHALTFPFFAANCFWDEMGKKKTLLFQLQ